MDFIKDAGASPAIIEKIVGHTILEIVAIYMGLIGDEFRVEVVIQDKEIMRSD
ncbi:hypothetical protein N9383_02625 [Granulosicoccus sp.]|nr:hypothetical protein [Granulosicoccus sp.]